ncbi:MAG: ABC transporter substrate-binding protein [Candidatus Thorarchaeota archaeon]
MEIEKKKLAIIILAVILGVSGVGNVLLTLLAIYEQPPESGEILRLPWIYYPPVTIDPCNSIDRFSNDILDQVVETLVAYDLTDPDLPLVGSLAKSWYWLDNTTIEFKLRENVFFHDGSRLTADCVLHTFTRINFFGNWTGTLDPDKYTMAFPHSLYKFEDGMPIFNDTLSFTTGDYNVTLVLNRPYAPIEGLLGYTASAIVHPDSTPADNMLDVDEDLIIGTGPFKLVRYIPNSEIRFARWERYWRTGAYWDEIVYAYYTDYVTAFHALRDGDLDWLPFVRGKYHWWELNVTITGDGVHDYINGSVFWYITFNSEIVNKTWRKAISHAFNYTYLIEAIDDHSTVRATSLVPPGFPAHNSSTRGARYNIPLARQYMQKMGHGVGWDVGSQVGNKFTPGAHESLWKSAQFIPDIGNFSNKQWNFRHREGSHFMELLIDRFIEDMDLIGIDIYSQILTYEEFIEMGQTHPDKLHIYYFGWGSDYLETFNLIDPLVNNESASNFARINDPHIQNLLEQTIAETNTAARHILYKRLQGYIIDVQYYYMPLEYDKIWFVHAPNLKGFPYNCMKFLYWYPTYRE